MSDLPEHNEGDTPLNPAPAVSRNSPSHATRVSKKMEGYVEEDTILPEGTIDPSDPAHPAHLDHEKHYPGIDPAHLPGGSAHPTRPSDPTHVDHEPMPDDAANEMVGDKTHPTMVNPDPKHPIERAERGHDKSANEAAAEHDDSPANMHRGFSGPVDAHGHHVDHATDHMPADIQVGTDTHELRGVKTPEDADPFTSSSFRDKALEEGTEGKTEDEMHNTGDDKDAKKKKKFS